MVVHSSLSGAQPDLAMNWCNMCTHTTNRSGHTFPTKVTMVAGRHRATEPGIYITKHPNLGSNWGLYCCNAVILALNVNDMTNVTL